GITAFEIGFFTEQKVQVRHGIIVIFAKRDSFIQVVDAFLHLLLVLRLNIGAELLVFDRLVGLNAGGSFGVHATLVSFGPIDDSNGVIGFRIAGISLQYLFVVLLGLL